MIAELHALVLPLILGGLAVAAIIALAAQAMHRNVVMHWNEDVAGPHPDRRRR